MKNVTKSLTALLLALVMSLTLLPTQVLAAESGIAARSSTGTVYATEYVNPIYADVLQSGTGIRIQAIPSTQAAVAAQAADSVNYLTEAEAVKELRKQMIARNENITLSVKLSSGDDVGAAVQRIWESAQGHVSGCGTAGDYLRWQYGGFSCPEFPYSDDGKYITFTVTYQRAASRSSLWYTTAKQETQLTSYIKSTILPQLALNGKTTYQKVQAIYDWITRNVRYDKKNLDDNSYYLKYTAYAAAINKTAVCQGYANLFYRLANDAGIDCRIVAGLGNGGSGWGGHSWNIVRMDDGKYYCLDATWDEGQTKYSYFLKGTTAFNTDHMVNAKITPYWSGYAAKVSAADYKVKAADTKATVGTVELTGAKGAADGITVTWKAAANAAKYVVYRKTADSKWVKLTTVASGTLSYKDTSAAHGVQYTYTVKGIAADGTAGKANSTGVSAMRAPAAVKMGKATASSANITVTWGKADGAAKYVVYRKTADSKWVKLATVGSSTLKYADKTAARGVTYYYTVLALAADGKTKSGYDKAGVPAIIAPAKVELGKISANAADVTITWTKADGADKYYVYRKDTKNTSWKKLAAVDSSTLKYVDKTVANGVQYTYTVLACAADGKTKGGYDSTGLTVMMVPATVELSKATHSATNITVTWKAAAGAKTYRVYRKAAGESKWTTVAKSVSGTSYTDKTVKVGVKYTYTVKGIASDGKTLSAKYNAAGVSDTLPKGATPAKVELGKISANAAGVTITWTKADGADKYYVYRKDTKNTSWKKLAAVDSSTLKYVDKTVANGVQYTYTVLACAADGKTKGGYDSTGLTVMMVPATVELSKATHSATNITVTWKAAAGAKTYRVYRKAAGESKWTTVAKSVSGTSYTDKTVKVGVKYTYTVKGIASDGKTLSAKYNAAGVSDTLPKGATPAKVTLTGISTDSAGITIRWQKAANATKYYVYRKDTTNTKWKKVAVVSSTGAASYSYKDTTVTRNVAYTYTVRGVSSDGQTMGGYNAAGKTAKVTASASATPAYVTMKDARRVTSGTKGIRLTWTTTNNAKTYNVYRAANPPKDKKGNPANVPTSKWKLVGQKVDALSFLDVTGKSGVTYAYTVRGVAANGKTLSTNYNTVGLRATMP